MILSLDNHYALAIDSFDNVWIADTNNDRIVAYDSSGNFLTKYGIKNSDTGFEDNGPRGIAFDSASSIFYVTDTKGNTIHKFQNNLVESFNVPGVPTDFTATPGDTIVSLTWVAPTDDGGAAIDYYKVLFREVNSGQWILTTNEITDTSAVVPGLTNDQEYEFAVFAHNSAGDGTAASVTATPVVGSVTVPDAPTGLTAIPGSTQVSLTWIAPSDGGSPITDYLVEFSDDNGATWESFDHDDATVTETVTGLTNGQEYFFRVSAINVIGTGPAIGGAPEIETSRVDHNDDDAEEADDGDMYLDSSDLELIESDEDNEYVGIRFNLIEIPQGTSITSAYVQFTTDETDDDETTLTIKAEATDNSLRFVDEDDEDNEITHDISNRPTTTASVSWSPADWDSNGEAGDDQRTPNIKSIIQEVIDRPNWQSDYSLSIIITGDGKRVAESHDGDSGAAPLLTITYGDVVTATPVVGSVTVPDAPTGLTAIPGNTQVTLSWITPTDGGSPITDYLVEFRATTISVGPGETALCHAPPGNPNNVQTLVVSDSAVSNHLGHGDAVGECVSINPWEPFAHGDDTVTEIVTNLTNNVLHEFRISAINFIGTGVSSSVVTATPVVGSVTVPDAPTGLTAIPGSTQVSLTWIAPSDGGSPITDYLVEFSDDNGATWESFDHDDATVTETVTGLTNGQEYFFRVSAINVIGTGPAIGGAPEIETSRVDHNDDDAEEADDGDMYLDSSDLELIESDEDNEYVGIRFNLIEIPQGTSITSAYVQFTTDETDDDETTLTIKAEATDNSLRFVDEDDEDNEITHDISNRPTTTASVSWSPADWDSNGEAGDDQRTPNIKSIIQEVIDRPNWQSDYSLSIIITGDGKRVAESHDGDSGAAPLLTITYGDVVTATPQAGVTVPGTPTNLTAIPGNTQVTLSWIAPDKWRFTNY